MTKTITTKKATKKLLPCFTRDLLIECFEKGDEWSLNRRISEKVKELPATAVFPVIRTLVHHHAAFRPVKAHMRCVVVVNGKGQCLIVDVPMSFFKKLPMR